MVPRAARPAPEAGPPAARWSRDSRRGRGPPPAAALVGSAMWHLDRPGAGGWRWERAVGVDCSAPEPRCLWLPYLSHSDRHAPGSRWARVSAEGVGAAGRGRGWGWGRPRGEVGTPGRREGTTNSL